MRDIGLGFITAAVKDKVRTFSGDGDFPCCSLYESKRGTFRSGNHKKKASVHESFKMECARAFIEIC